MTDCNQRQRLFPRCKGRRVEASFSGGNITSNGGVALLCLRPRKLAASSPEAIEIKTAPDMEWDGLENGELRQCAVSLFVLSIPL